MKTEIETINVAENGDYVIKASTKVGEEYVLTNSKFEKLYKVGSKTSQDVPFDLARQGYFKYDTIREIRQAIVVKKEVLTDIKKHFSEVKIPSQDSLKEYLKPFETHPAVKKAFAYARKVTDVAAPEKIVTRTTVGYPIEFYFIAPWGETQAVAENDILIINENEVYRISRAEFDQTYSFVKGGGTFSP